MYAREALGVKSSLVCLLARFVFEFVASHRKNGKATAKQAYYNYSVIIVAKTV